MRTFSYLLNSLLFILIFSLSVHGQGNKPTFYQNVNEIQALDDKGDTLMNPWVGGMLNPQFSNVDLNGDGMQDLVLFDRFDNPGKILTFINQGYGYFKYEPWYETYFPAMYYWCILKDYNNDGKQDIFCSAYPPGYIEVYTNTTPADGPPSFKLFKHNLQYRDFYSPNGGSCCPYSTRVYSSAQEIPDIDDIDNTGVVQILAADVGSSQGNYYINRALTKHSNPDSLDLAIRSRCWMEYYELTTYNVDLGESCGGPINITQSASHIGYNLLTLDLTGEGNKDLIMGDLQWNNLIAIYNGKNKYSWPEDTAVAWDSLFPSNTLPVYIPQFPAPFYVDIDNDGNRDLVCTPQQTADGSANLNDIWYYHNKGTDSLPVFEFVQKDFLLNTTLEFGKKSCPAFFDYNGDGLPDMIVATLGDFTQTQHSYERLVLYENVGTAQKAVFKKVDDDYLHLSSKKLIGLRPAFGDLNGDGAVDMLLGTSTNIYFFKNISSKGQKDSFVLDSGNYAGLDTLDSYSAPYGGTYLTPYIVDMNKDGLNDLVIGDVTGNFYYFENTGTASKAKFTLKTNLLGKARTNTYYWNYIYSTTTGNIIDSVWTPGVPAYSIPVVADINGDGKLDLISGSFSGEIFVWLDIEDHITDSCPNRVDTFFYNYKTAKLEDKFLGNNTAVAVAFLDGDSLPDLMIGNDRGGLNFFSQKSLPLGIAPVSSLDNRFKAYPNPTDKYLTIQATTNNPLSNVNITLYTLSGQSVFEKQFKKFSGSVQINVSKLAAGIYYISVASVGSEPWTTKVEVR